MNNNTLVGEKVQKYFDDNQCAYCGVYETNDPGTPDGWFAIDDELNKICPACESGERKPDEIEWYGLQFACGCGPFVAYDFNPKGKKCHECRKKYAAL